VLFGLFHGVLVIAYGLAARHLPERGRVPWLDGVLIASHLVVVGLIGALLFRETHTGRLLRHLSSWPWTGTADDQVAAGVVVGVTLAGCVPLFAQWLVMTRLVPRVRTSPWFLPLQTTTWAGLAASMFLFFRTTLQDFVYFQF